MLLMIDNYDSFTYNLVQYFQQLGQQVVVKRNDQININDIEALAPSHLVISPGPCTPDTAGISLEAIEHFAGSIPILGVCLGHQAIAQAFGSTVVKSARVMHGKTSLINHTNLGIFASLNQPLRVTRYHSLEVDVLPEGFRLDAWYDDPLYGQEIMAMSHRELPIWGVQFHPESVLTEQGHELLRQFLQQ